MVGEQPKLNVLILGCDTGLDISHGMGEVTNAWVTVQNVGGGDAANVSVMLTANDEEEQHPDKTASVQLLPLNSHITFELTVDTKSGADTDIKAIATSNEGAAAESTRPACEELSEAEMTAIMDAGKLAQVFSTPQQGNTPSTDTSQESVQYLPPLGKIWAGVKVYYGRGNEKAYGFQILGGSEQCSSIPSGRGLKVRYPDGTEEWKDRDNILLSDLYFVREDDPAIKAMDWYEFDDCP